MKARTRPFLSVVPFSTLAFAAATFSFVAPSFAAPSFAAPSFAAGAAPPTIEEIVVTGELRSARLIDSPASISVISLGEQRSGMLNHLEELLGRVPNVNLASGGSRARFVQIRGIGERGQFAEPLNPSVGLVLDGVDLSGVGLTATLFDVDQVEVLRGPQGTVYGANALAGLINVRSADPTERFESRLRLDVGDYAARGLGASVSGPLTTRLGYRLAVQQYQDDGYVDNRFLGRDDTSDRDELTVRGKLVWEPGANQRWVLAAGLVDADNGYDVFSLDNDRNTRSDEPGRDRQETRYASLATTWDLSDAVTLAATLGGSRGDSDYGYDEDWTFAGFHPDGYSSTDHYRRERDNVSLDVRLLSGPAGALFGGRTEWVAGIYLLDQQVDLRRRYTFFDDDFTSAFDVQRVAVYGELSHALGERTRLIAGLRGERHDADYRDSDGLDFDPVDRMLGGRLVLEHRLDGGTMLYASVARGYKAGGFNIGGTLDAERREYDPETLWNYELGLKGQWLDGRLTARAAAFAMARDDVQVDTSITLVRDDGSAEFIDLIDNAAEGSNRGVELELDYTPVAAVTLFASVGVMRSEFDRFVNSSGEDLDGEDQAHAPEYQYFAGLELRPAPNWFVRLEGEGRDGFYLSNSNRFVPEPDDVRTDAYALWHVSAGYRGERLGMKIWARNLTDEAVVTRGFYFGNDPRDGYTPRGYFQLGEPRRYGVSLTLNL
jgi:iron complex outermembrane recepter protein